MAIEINDRFKEAIKLMEESDKNVFITGRAGTGKSTLLTHFRAHSRKKTVVLAPTGVAALNVQGQTIHSFFGFPPTITPEQARKEHPFEDLKNLIEKVDVIIIDEVSMLRADLLDSIDQALRQYGKMDSPFGGTRIVFIGDLYQLPPVLTREEQEEFLHEYASPYFFDAKVFKEDSLQILELEKIYRQKDKKFIELLNAVRDTTTTEEHLSLLNARKDENYEAYNKPNEITLCTTNAAADEINAAQLKKIKGKAVALEGRAEGDFMRQLPTEKHLKMKVGAQIMLLNNDATRRWVNGSMGKITGFGWDEKQNCDVLKVELDTGKEVEVVPFTWEANHYYFNKKSNAIEMETVGAFTQHPVRLAWAVTIHKGQGKTFDNVVVDIGNGAFANGQVYVALSRCTSLKGLVLRKPILKHHMWSDFRIHGFLSGTETETIGPSQTTREKIAILDSSIDTESEVTMDYVTANGNRMTKRIRPRWVGEMEYEGNTYLGLEASWSGSERTRVFSVKRILRVEEWKEAE